MHNVTLKQKGKEVALQEILRQLEKFDIDSMLDLIIKLKLFFLSEIKVF